MLLPAKIKAQMSAEEILNGSFDYNATPLAPPGTKVPVHENLDKRKSWNPHVADGWYLVPEMEYYRRHKSTPPKQELIVYQDHLNSPHATKLPRQTEDQAILESANELIAEIQNKNNIYVLTISTGQASALQQLVDFLSGGQNQYH